MKTQPVIAWRCWLPGDRLAAWPGLWLGEPPPGLLMAITEPYHVWEIGANQAHCWRVARHAPPIPKCECGFYGVALEALADVARGIDVDIPRVIGAAFYWGRTVRHAQGVRSEFAAVGCIVGDGELERRAAERYGVPCVATVEESLAWARAQDAVVLASRPAA